jgi:hypothetical protein
MGMFTNPQDEPPASKAAPDDLFRAYSRTSFEADVPGGRIRIRVGQMHLDLDELLRTHSAKNWVYITACNPASTALSDRENRCRQQDLEDSIRAKGNVHFAGAGVGDVGHWQPEPSFLILGVSRQEAILWGQELGQNAVVWGAFGKTATLLDCRPSA